MTDRAADISPQRYARIGGALYLIIIVIGLFTELGVRATLMVSGDATATARAIMASEQLWRTGFAGSILMLMCAVPLALIMYVLLRPVNRDIALLAAFFNLVSIAVEAVSDHQLFAALAPLGGAAHLQAFEPEQLHVLAYHAARMHASGYNISLAFFGLNCLCWGYLIFRSGFLPRVLGVLLVVCAFCYVANSFAWFLTPAFATALVPGILVPCFLAEASICLWLVVRGVNVPNWKEKAR